MGDIIINHHGDNISVWTTTLEGFDANEAPRAAKRLMDEPLEGMCGVMWKTEDWSRTIASGTSVLRIFFIPGALHGFRARYGVDLEEYLQQHYLGQ